MITKFQPSIAILGPNAACKKFGDIKCKSDPISSAMAAEIGHRAKCALIYHHPLSIAVLKIKNKKTLKKSIKFWENGEIECF